MKLLLEIRYKFLFVLISSISFGQDCKIQYPDHLLYGTTLQDLRWKFKGRYHKVEILHQKVDSSLIHYPLKQANEYTILYSDDGLPIKTVSKSPFTELILNGNFQYVDGKLKQYIETMNDSILSIKINYTYRSNMHFIDLYGYTEGVIAPQRHIRTSFYYHNNFFLDSIVNESLDTSTGKLLFRNLDLISVNVQDSTLTVFEFSGDNFLETKIIYKYAQGIYDHFTSSHYQKGEDKIDSFFLYNEQGYLEKELITSSKKKSYQKQITNTYTFNQNGDPLKIINFDSRSRDYLIYEFKYF